MKKQWPTFILLILSIFVLTGCRRTADNIWDDTKTASRHVGRGFRALGGKHGDSRQVNSRGIFYGEGFESGDACFVDSACEFVPLEDLAENEQMMTEVVRPPRETPGDPGSSIPGIDAFNNPGSRNQWAAVFRTIYFPYNSNLVKGSGNLQVIHDIANYMRNHPRIYIFVEGHCDERGPELYNFALGSHRANAVRNLLINEGVDLNHVFTVSYGKDRPEVIGHDEESWQQNRRAEFKIYEK